MKKERGLIGKSIGEYFIIKVLGQGGFATVYLAENSATKEKVAIKMAASLYEARQRREESTIVSRPEARAIDWSATDGPAETTLDPWEVNELLEREGEALERITHPAFVKVLHKGAYYGISYLVLEYIQGETLREKIQGGDIIPLQYLVDIINAVIAVKKEGLEYHGDIKPGNIIIRPDGSVKIIDPSSPGLKGKPSIQITTPLYNPRWLKNDINSLGILLYEISTGILPFQSSDSLIEATDLNPKIPKEINDIIMKALNLQESRIGTYKHGGDYQSLLEMREDLVGCLQKGISTTRVPRRGKADAIMQALSPYFDEVYDLPRLKKIVAYIINYSSGLWPSLVKEDYRGETIEGFKHAGLKIGDSFLGRYEIADIKHGGISVVYLTYDSREKRPLIIKTIHPRYLKHREAIEKFKSTAKIWLSIPEHKNIVKARSLEEIEGHPYLFLEYVEGTDLKQLIRDRSLDVSQALDIAIQLCEAVDHVFRTGRIVHRDIKPAHILLSKDGVVKLVGFGLAKVTAPESEMKEEICGTPPYMPPEQWTSLPGIDTRADIYSFGCVLYEMLTDKPPFHPKASGISGLREMHLNETPQNPKAINSLIPSTLDAVVMKCLQKNPADRYQSFGELRQELMEIYSKLD